MVHLGILMRMPKDIQLSSARLKEKFAEAFRRDDVKAIVFTGKNGRFSGGFDINVFQKVHATGDISQLPDVSVELVSNTLEDAKKPIVAVVQGLALGGGLEVAMHQEFNLACLNYLLELCLVLEESESEDGLDEIDDDHDEENDHEPEKETVIQKPAKKEVVMCMCIKRNSCEEWMY